ncbi:hypothetical protein [Myroides sp. WP-1]|uniref:hypothetical protein n=1 Tax=Myroides sp. WP-1 TaxID=2759944 RepID=UPI0021033ABE|nr:hypothetical protein [Myroides sp. WP-1]
MKVNKHRQMKLARFFMVLFGLLPLVVFGQKTTFTPDMMVGNRSYGYTHTISHQLSDKITLQNLVLFDSEYQDDNHNIFFIRNTVAYKLPKNFILNAGFGVKNPGKFASVYLQYQWKKKDFQMVYGIGTTYQKGFTLEQSLLVEYTPQLTEQWRGLFRLSAVGNVNRHEYTRGFQHIRIGVKKDNLAIGLAANLEQFNMSWDHFENYGVFVKVNL